MDIIKRIISYRSDRRRRSRDSFIDSLFVLEERAGQMWLTCDGHAILAFPADAHSEDMLAAAGHMRLTAKAFDRHIAISDDNGDNDNDDADNPDPVILNVTGFNR